MEELSEPLSKALARQEFLRVRDPWTEQIYVVVRAEVFDRLSQEEGLPPLVARSKRAFLRDLPALLRQSKYDRWCACYAGDERIGIAQSETDLLRDCQKRGLKPDQYFIGMIAPHRSEIEDVDPSPHEFDPIQE